MTEAEWLACAHPEPMLQFLRGSVSERKLRLFACACVRRGWHLPIDGRCRRAVDVAERYADGLSGRGELAVAQHQAGAAIAFACPLQRPAVCREYYVALAAREAVCDTAHSAAKNASATFASAADGYCIGRAASMLERRYQACLLRELVGAVPFRAPAMPASVLTWDGGIVRTLAQCIYDDRAFDLLPVLADALEDAGCTDQDILSHCRACWLSGRGEQPNALHVRGCWAVDFLLGMQ